MWCRSVAVVLLLTGLFCYRLSYIFSDSFLIMLSSHLGSSWWYSVWSVFSVGESTRPLWAAVVGTPETAGWGWRWWGRWWWKWWREQHRGCQSTQRAHRTTAWLSLHPGKRAHRPGAIYDAISNWFHLQELHQLRDQLKAQGHAEWLQRLEEAHKTVLRSITQSHQVCLCNPTWPLNDLSWIFTLSTGGTGVAAFGSESDPQRSACLSDETCQPRARSSQRGTEA